MNRPPPNQNQNQQPGGNGNPLNDIAAWFNAMPFVTRYLFALFAGTTLVGNLGLVSPFSLVLIPSKVWKGFEIWRLITCFFFDKLGLNFVINLYFLYKNSLELESTLFANRTADYLFFILFEMLALVVVGWYMQFILLTEGLIMAVIYLWAQYYRDRTVSFMFGFQFKAIYFPFVLIAWDFLTTGHTPSVKIAGILTAHLYYFLDRILPEQTNRRYLNTPGWLVGLVPNQEVPRVGGFGSGGVEVVQGRGREQGQQGGVQQRHAWGAGQRLGE